MAILDDLFTFFMSWYRMRMRGISHSHFSLRRSPYIFHLLHHFIHLPRGLLRAAVFRDPYAGWPRENRKEAFYEKKRRCSVHEGDVGAASLQQHQRGGDCLQHLAHIRCVSKETEVRRGICVEVWRWCGSAFRAVCSGEILITEAWNGFLAPCFWHFILLN